MLDLCAAARAALHPDDDLALAAVLKSPLIGLDDEALIELAPGRAGFARRGAGASSPAIADGSAKLETWRRRAASCRRSIFSPACSAPTAAGAR